MYLILENILIFNKTYDDNGNMNCIIVRLYFSFCIDGLLLKKYKLLMFEDYFIEDFVSIFFFIGRI